MQEEPISGQTELPKRSIGFGTVARICALGLFVYCAFGVLIYPNWWYELIFERHYTEIGYWGIGNYYGIFNTISFLLPSALTVWAILSLSTTEAAEKLQSVNRKIWSGMTNVKGFVLAFLVLATVFGVGLYSAGPRTADYRNAMANIAESQRKLQESMAKAKSSESPPLSVRLHRHSRSRILIRPERTGASTHACETAD